MRRLALFALLLILLAGCVMTFDDDPLAPAQLAPPTKLPAAAQLPAATATPAGVLPGRGEISTSHGAIVLVRIHFEDGFTQDVYPGLDLATATPEPTRPPDASATPGATLTPPPTNTPRPTATPLLTAIATFTPVIEPSPTAEPAIPTVTPGPTIPPKVCSLRSAHPDGVSPINIRQGPATTFAITGKWSRGTELSFNEFVPTRDYLWGKNATGYMVVYDYGLSQWWVTGSLSSELCDEVTGWPAGLAPPGPIAQRDILGKHLLIGVVSNAIVHLDQVSVVKGLNGSYEMAFKARQLKPSIKVICRSLVVSDKYGPAFRDGPTAAQWTDPEQYFKAYIGYVPDGCDYYEFMNEWDSAPSWRVFADFSIAMLDQFGQAGKCALAGSHGPGNPELGAWNELVRVLRWIDEHPCGPGRYHGYAWHQSGLMPASVPLLPGSYINNPWIAMRDQLIEQQLNTVGYSLRRFRGPIYITEWGFEDYTIPNQGFTCEQVRAGVRLSLQYFREKSPWITGVLVWNYWSMGEVNKPDDGKWVDLTPCEPLV